MPNIKNVFDWIKVINQTKEPISTFSEADWDLFNPFLVHRGLSQDPNLVELCDYVQGLNIQDKKQIYSIYKELIPKNKRWNGWIKSKTKDKNKELVEHISSYFECSNKRAKEYIEILNKEEIKNILLAMAIDEKEIKKLIK